MIRVPYGCPGSLAADALFSIARAHFLLGELAACRRYLARLLRLNPEHEGGAELLGKVVTTVNRDGPVGLAMLTGIGLAVSCAF